MLALGNRSIGADDWTLQQLDTVCEGLANDVRWIVSEIRALRTANVLPRYCLDYDVLFETRKRDETELAEVAFWSTLALDLKAFQVVLLPGTLFEILRYAQDRLDAVKRVSNTKIGSAFINSITELNFKRIGETQGELLLAFRHATVSEGDYYLRTVVQQRARLVEGRLPTINRNLFYQCIVQLSQGSRINKILNNRVDAYNYALIAALNDNPNTGYRYLLVSTSRFMRNLDNHAWHRIGGSDTVNNDDEVMESPFTLSKLQYRRVVVSPRRAAIFQLLASAGDGIGSRSAQLAWGLQAAIRKAQQDIAGRISDANNNADVPLSDVRAIRSDNIFLQLISSFVAIQNRIVEAHRQKRESIDILSKQYDLRNPVAFFEDLNDAISKILRDDGYRAALREEIPRKTVKLNLKTREKDSRFSYARHVDAIGPGKDLAFSYFGYEDSHLFLSRGQIALGAFVSLYNVIATDVYSKIAAKVYDGWGPSKKVGFVLGGGDKLIEYPLQELTAPLRIRDLERLFNSASEEINFVRINQPWFELSYEERAFVFSTPFPMIDEIALFLQETAVIDNRGANYRELVNDLLRPSP